MLGRLGLSLTVVVAVGCGDSARDRYRDTSAVEQVPAQQYYPSDAAYQTQPVPAPAPAYAAPAPAYAPPPPPQQPAYQPAYQQAPAPQRAAAPAPRIERAPAPAPVAPPAPKVLVSAGTTLFASPRADVCSSELSVGERFEAYVVESSDAPVTGHITFEVADAAKAGGAHERPRLRVIPVELTVDGRAYPLSADVLEMPTRERRLQGSGRRDARNAVVGAAVGAVAGQLLGRDTKSTVAGAAAGAAVGGAGSYATADRDVCVSVGSRIGLSVRNSVVE